MFRAKNFDDWINLYRAHVGKIVPEIRPPCYDVATRKAIRLFAWAVGDENPLWLDAAYAVETRWGQIIAPPMFPVSVRYPAPYITEPGPRGVDLVDFYNGLEINYYDVIRIMDELRSEKRMISVEKKIGEIGLYEGPYAELVAETTIWNQHKEVVCKMRGSSLRVPRPQAGELFYEREIYGYSDEEVESIKKGIKDEFRAGGRMPLWDDVKTGDKLTPVVKPPINITDMENCEVAIIGWPYRAYEPNYYDMLSDPDATIKHSIIGFPVNKTQTWDSVISKDLGMPLNWSPGIFSDAMLGHLLANWMGDDGFVRKISSETRYPYFYGDTLWWTGIVKDKKVTVEGNTVDVTFEAINELDITVVSGCATVLLPSVAEKRVHLPIPH